MMKASDPQTLSDKEFEALVSVGRDVLRVFPHEAGACVMMSALYAGRLHSLGHRSARLVGGALAIGGSTVFGRSTVSSSFEWSNLDWDGHAWVAFGEYVADVSVVITAYSEKAPPLLARHIRQRLRSTQRLYIATPEAACREDSLLYTQQHTFSPDQVEILYRGALTFIS